MGSGNGAVRPTGQTTTIPGPTAPIVARLLAQEQTTHRSADALDSWTSSACNQTSTYPPAMARTSVATVRFRYRTLSGSGETMEEPSISSGRSAAGLINWADSSKTAVATQ